MPPVPHLDLAKLDCEHIVADKEAIRRVNPQRFEVEQLDAIIYIDPTEHVVAGYKDVRADEFWVRGHMPGYPILPGVLMCEAAAQLCSFQIATETDWGGDFIGFGGMENVRFRKAVHPGDRLVLIAKATKPKTIDLQWVQSVTPGITNNKIYRRLMNGGVYPSSPTATTTSPATSYRDSNLVSRTGYCYVVTASNANGESARSNEACASPK